MVVYLVQHAKALSKTQDPDRPLSDSGIADMALITAFIKPLCLEIDIIWHSSKTRARQTAKLLADVIDSPKPPYEHEGLEPDELIVYEGQTLLEGGARVRVVETVTPLAAESAL